MEGQKTKFLAVTIFCQGGGGFLSGDQRAGTPAVKLAQGSLAQKLSTDLIQG